MQIWWRRARLALVSIAQNSLNPLNAYQFNGLRTITYGNRSSIG
jgi:hypothetical protein